MARRISRFSKHNQEELLWLCIGTDEDNARHARMVAFCFFFFSDSTLQGMVESVVVHYGK